MHPARAACLLALLLTAPLRAEDPEITKEEEARRALRRSPVVEVYDKCQRAVVFLTFPVPKGGNPILNEFFAIPGVPEEAGLASGFVVHEGGYLVTNAHAVSSIAMHAHLADGRALPVDVVGVDHSLDLAVVRVRPERPLPVLPLARGTDTMVGETVVVIGSPHGLRQSCATGVVSGLGRDVTIPGGMTLRRMVQVSAPINPGNSGGPVLNIVGEVLGVATVRKPDASAIDFAIPAETVRKALPRLLDCERRQGIVTGLTFSADGSGKVEAVAADSPAAAAGIRPGDVVRRVEGRPLVSESDFHLRLLDRKPGDEIPLTLRRAGEAVDVRLTLGKRPRPDAEALLARLGLKGTVLDTRKATAMRLRQAKGVLLSEVKAALYPEKQKPEVGDVLARINDVRPDDLDHVGRLLAAVPPGQPVRLVFLRQRENTVTRMDVSVTPPAK